MTIAPRPEPGTRLTFRWRKWDGSPHWEHEIVYLGSDEWGDWVGQPRGARSHRPGRESPAREPNVTLLAPSGEFAFTRNARPHPTHTYIDLAWAVGWAGDEPGGIDMDLDVVDEDGRVWIDDEDEWDEHRVLYGYPADVQAALTAKAAQLKAQVIARTAPFDEATPSRWLDVLAALTTDPPRLDA